MTKAINYNLSNLLNFKGRESRPVFWYYVLFLVVVYFLLQLVWALLVSMQSGEINVGRFLTGQLWLAVGMGALFAFLLLAAFVRRLHDIGLSGWVALIPYGCYAYALIISAMMLYDAIQLQATNSAADFIRLTSLVEYGQWVGAAYWIAILGVAVFGALAPDRGSNAYGAEALSAA